MDDELTVKFPPDRYEIYELVKFGTYEVEAPTDSALYAEVLVQINGDAELLVNFRYDHAPA